MKNTKLTLFMALFAATVLSAVVFSSCTKKNCNGVVCQNNGYCSGGNCVCPSGFSGTLCQSAATTYVSYKNNTFTPVSITVNGTTETIPVGQSVAFAGKYGTTATGTATTSGSASSLGIDNGGGVIGLTISWAINNDFPVSDTVSQSLDVGSTYFFLRMANKTSKDIIDFYVNVNFPYGQVYQDVTVPANGQTYDLGYYLAYPGSNVQTQSSNSTVAWTAVPLPFTKNQSYTVVVH